MTDIVPPATLADVPTWLRDWSAATLANARVCSAFAVELAAILDKVVGAVAPPPAAAAPSSPYPGTIVARPPASSCAGEKIIDGIAVRCELEPDHPAGVLHQATLAGSTLISWGPDEPVSSSYVHTAPIPAVVPATGLHVVGKACGAYGLDGRRCVALAGHDGDHWATAHDGRRTSWTPDQAIAFELVAPQ